MSSKRLSVVGAASEFENLTATVNDVVFCVQELKGQYEIVRQQVTYLSKHNETLLLQDAEIQTLKVAVKTIQDERKKEHSLSTKDSSDLLKMKLLVRDFNAQTNEQVEDLRKRSSLHERALELLKVDIDSWKGKAPPVSEVPPVTSTSDAAKQGAQIVEALQGKQKEKKSGGMLARMGLSRSPKRDTDKSGKDKSTSPAGKQKSSSPATTQPESPSKSPQKSATAPKPGSTPTTPQKTAEEHTAHAAPTQRVTKGSVLKCIGNDEQEHAEIYESMVSHEIIGNVNHGQNVTATGDPADVEGYMMVPIAPKGAVQLDLFEHIPATSLQSKSEAKGNDETKKALSRGEMLSSIFKRFDNGDKGALREADLLKFMRETNEYRDCEFEGSDAEWSKEYQDLCLEGGWDAKAGLDKPAFSRLLSDKANEEYYCTDEQLAEMVAALLKTSSKST